MCIEEDYADFICIYLLHFMKQIPLINTEILSAKMKWKNPGGIYSWLLPKSLGGLFSQSVSSHSCCPTLPPWLILTLSLSLTVPEKGLLNRPCNPFTL